MILKPLLSICFALLCSSALAAEDNLKWEKTNLPGIKNPMLCHPGSPHMCVLRLEQGEKAPWTGILQTDRQAAELSVRADPERLKARVDEAVETAKKVAANDLELEKKMHQIDVQAFNDKMKAMEESHARQIELVAPRWYEEPAFVIPVTVVVTLGAVAATVAIADKLAN